MMRRVGARELALILASVLLAASGQVMMRLGVAPAAGQGLLGTLGQALGTPLVLAGIAAYAASTVSWLVVLSRVPLSVAYPFAALSYVVVVAVAVISGEAVGALRWAGVALIVAGVFLVSRDSAEARS